MQQTPDDMSDRTPTAADHLDPAADCDGAITLSDRGNTEFAWWYLTNGSDRDATLTIRLSWIVAGQTQTETKQQSLYPKQEFEVFSFPRNQSPRVTFLSCTLG